MKTSTTTTTTAPPPPVRLPRELVIDGVSITDPAQIAAFLGRTARRQPPAPAPKPHSAN